MTQVTLAVKTSSFTTAGLPPEQKMSMWQEYNSDALMGLRCRALAGVEFGGTTVNVELGTTKVARIRASAAHVIERTPELVSRQPRDSVVLFFGLAGEAFFYHSDGVRQLGPGQLVVCDTDRPFMRGFSNEFEEIFFKVPRHAFLTHTGLEDLSSPLFVDFADSGNPVAKGLAKHVNAAARSRHEAPPDEDLMLRLVGALLGRHDEAHESAYLAAAQTYIDSRLSDPSLSAASVAAAVGISPRHLSRVMATAGSSFPRYVLGRRLELAKSMLEQPSSPFPTVAAVAARCGFTSTSTFSGSFTNRFGVRASEVRRTAMLTRSLGPAQVGSPVA